MYETTCPEGGLAVALMMCEGIAKLSLNGIRKHINDINILRGFLDFNNILRAPENQVIRLSSSLVPVGYFPVNAYYYISKCCLKCTYVVAAYRLRLFTDTLVSGSICMLFS